MNRIYDIEIKKLAVLLLPTFMRKIRIVAWLHCLVTPLVSLHYAFMQKRQADLYNLNHNGQVCYLRAVLNDSFDVEKRRIRIVDGNSYKRNYIYTRGEQKSKHLGVMYLHERADYSDTGVDFIVEVPRETYKENEMKALIDFYRLASKRYKIIQV